MRESKPTIRILVEHFFRRFFDNDTIQVEGDTLITVIRAAAIVAVPGLMFAFWLQNSYPYRPLWGTITDQYFFVLFSFVVMGAASIFEWEMLFPDRLDFLILSPLPIKPTQMLAAKASALVGFFAIFLFSSNVFGAALLPLLGKPLPFRQMYAHTVAVLLAGTFASLFFLALGGTLLCVLDSRRFRQISPLMQMFSITALVLLFVHYLEYANSLQALLSAPQGLARWIPPLWFLGVYESLLHGDAAPAFAHLFARYALEATALAALTVVVTYPVAWRRMRIMAVEGTSQPRRPPAQWIAGLVHRIIRHPGERAVFHFIGPTIARNNRYQVYLALYCGTGLALAIACAVSLPVSHSTIQFALSPTGLHALMPLLLFWMIAGLRTALAFPLNLPAGWVFRVTGVKVGECSVAVRTWVFACAVGVMGGILVALRLPGWDLRHLLVQSGCGLCHCVLLTDGFFFFQRTVPFNQPRMPGKTSLPLMLTLYVGIFRCSLSVSFTWRQDWRRTSASFYCSASQQPRSMPR